MSIRSLNIAPRAGMGFGLLALRCRTYNQHGKVVQDMTATLLIARRPA